MCRFTRSGLAAFATLALFIVPGLAKADTVKSSLFVFGIHTAGVEGVATEFSGRPTDRHPGAMALIKRNLKWSIDAAEGMKWDSAELKTLLSEVDSSSFAKIAATMAGLRTSYQAKFAKNINPGAPAYFIIGIQLSGAEAVALGAAAFPREKRPGSSMLIERNLKWLKEGAPTLKLSTALLLKIEADHLNGIAFGTTATELAKLRLAWQAELSGQPGFDGTGPGVVILSKDGNITKTDPMDVVRKGSHAKVFPIRLKAGKTYLMDLHSGDGRAGAHNPGFFDTYLRVEDAGGKNLISNDDGGDNFNSRLEFTPMADAEYRLVVTTYHSGATGSFNLKVRER